MTVVVVLCGLWVVGSLIWLRWSWSRHTERYAKRPPEEGARNASLIDAIHFSNRLQTDLRSRSPSIPFRCDCGHVVPSFFAERIDKGDGALGDGQLTRCLNCLYGYPYPNDDEIEDAYATRLEAWKASQKSDSP